MKKFYLFLIIILFSSVFANAQKPKSTPKRLAAAKSKPAPADEKGDFEKASALTDATEKIAALQKFTQNYPQSAELNHALELLVVARAQAADEKLRAGDSAAGIELFKQAVTNAPNPLSDKLFSEVVLQFPTNLFYGGQPTAAVEVAKLIEEKIGSNAKQILGLATFYIGTENGSEAARLAKKAVEIDPQMPAAYQTLGLASRLNFQLDESVAAYAKAAELDPNSVVSKRSLAEMKRAVGKSDEAVALYREILEKNPDDGGAQTGLALALFDAEKQSDAETEMSKALEKNPSNLPLLVGAAYWYAAHKNAVKATDFAGKAIAVEPRYTWAHIAMARAMLLQNRYTDAEKELLLARQYGNFPTLTYELAAVRLNAGFYKEAAEELKKNFTISDDVIETNLGNRIPKQGKSFIELLAVERSASIFEPLAADSPEVADKLKALLKFDQNLDSSSATDDEINQNIGEFIKGDDKSKTHRELYAAESLLDAKKNLPKALELTQVAVGGVDSALQTPNAAGAVMADELYESRRLAIARGEVIVVPNLPNQTLSAILRGRIEETAGWALFNQNKPEEAVVRLKRAVSVLPEKSAWWRSSMWRLGTAFDASGKPALALDAYIKSYTDSPPDAIRYATIERVYQQVNGNLDGLESKIGAKPADLAVANTAPATAKVIQTPTPLIEKTPESLPIAKATPETTPTPEISPVQTPTPTVAELKPEATPTVSPKTESTPEVSTMPTATPEISATPISTPTPAPTPKTDSTPETKVENSTEPKPASSPSSFESVVIKIPSPEKAKSAKTETETAQTNSTGSSEKPKVDNAVDARPRVIVTQNSDAPQCQLEISQPSVTLSAGNGQIGILVSLPDDGDISKIVSSSSNPSDVTVALDPDIGKQANRAFFIIKSVSSKTGIYTITFDSPCGKKDVQVRVR